MALFKKEEEVRTPAVQERPAAPAQVTPQQQQPKSNLQWEGQMTFIGKNTVITGDISSDPSIELEGRVQGNITCKSEVTISGGIDGDVTAGSLVAEGAVINGNITSVGTVNLTKDTKVKGSVAAEKVVLAAQVQGDITARDLVVLKKEAVVLGNVTTKYIEIEMGASVEGSIATKGREEKKAPAKVREMPKDNAEAKPALEPAVAK